MKKLMGISLLAIFGVNSVNAQSLEIDFDGTESSKTTQLSAIEPDQQTNITSFGRSTTFFAGATVESAAFSINNVEIDLTSKKSVTFEAVFYNRRELPYQNYNEAWLWIGPNPNSTNTITTQPTVGREGIGVGYSYTGGTFISKNGSSTDPIQYIVLDNSNVGIVDTWVTMAATFVIDDNNFVLSSLTYNGTPVAAANNYVIGPASDYTWLNEVKFGFAVDDTIDSVKLSGPAYITSTIKSPSAIPANGLLALFGLVFVVIGLARKQFA